MDAFGVDQLVDATALLPVPRVRAGDRALRVRRLLKVGRGLERDLGYVPQLLALELLDACLLYTSDAADE